MTKILYNLPSRQRPDKLISCIENIISKATQDTYVIMVTLDIDDATVANMAFHEKLLSYEKVMPVYGFSKGKIDSINKNFWMVNDYDILVSTSDDILFTMEGFDAEIVCDMQKYFPQMDGLLHYPDGNKTGIHQITMPVCGKKYIERFGYIFHPSYISLWCDHELLEVAKYIKKYKFINSNIFSHNHPAFDKGENDALYERNQLSYRQDSDNYFKRLAINFEL